MPHNGPVTCLHISSSHFAHCENEDITTIVRIFTKYLGSHMEEKAIRGTLLLLLLLLLLLIFNYLLTAIDLSLGGSSPYTSTDKTNKNKYT